MGLHTMLDRISKIIAIIAATVASIVILIGGVAWAVRLDTDMRIVKSEVVELKGEVSELRRDVDEVKENLQRLEENQRLILQALEGLHVAIANHTHDADGRAQIPLSSQ